MGWLNDAVRGVGGLLRPRAGTPGDGADWWYTPLGSGRNHAGVYVTPDIALKASAVYACVKILAETISTMPLRMFRDLGTDGRVPAPDHPLDELIRFQPNSWQTAVEFWEMMILHAALRGTGYAEIVPGARGAVDQLIPLHGDRVKSEQLRDRSLRFKVTNPHTGETRTLLQEEVFRIPGMSSDGIRGLRAVDLAAEAIGLGMAGDAYAARVFSNNLNIGGYLKHPKQLSAEAQKNLIQAFMEKLAGINNAHRPIVLQEGMEFVQGSMVAKDAQLLEARKWQVGEIARFWRIPLHMLNVDDQTNRSTVEAQAIDFVKYTIRPWVSRIEQAIRRDLIIARQTYVAKYNMEGLLRGDSTARANYFSAALGAGGHAPWMTPEEVRVIEGMNPEPSLGRLVAPANPQAPAARLEDNSLHARAARLVHKEVTAIRKAAMRHAGEADAFRGWVRSFYGGHCSSVMSILDFPKDAARAYCDYQCKSVLASDNLEVLFEKWEDTVPDEIAQAGKQSGTVA